MPFYPACRLSLAAFDVGRLPGENRLSAPENLCPAFPVSRQRCRRRAAFVPPRSTQNGRPPDIKAPHCPYPFRCAGYGPAHRAWPPHRRRAALPYKGSGIPARQALGPERGSSPFPCTSCALEAFCFIRHNFLTENRVGEISSLLAARGACCNSSYFHFAPLRIKNRDTQISVPEISFFMQRVLPLPLPLQHLFLLFHQPPRAVQGTVQDRKEVVLRHGGGIEKALLHVAAILL